MHESEVQTVSVPIEVAQEYVSKLLGFAPLQLSDDCNPFLWLFNILFSVQCDHYSFGTNDRWIQWEVIG